MTKPREPKGVKPIILLLLLRSVYLKGHQDGNLKTTDLSWEDKILQEIEDYYKQKMLEWVGIDEYLTSDNFTWGDTRHNSNAVRFGMNTAKQEIRDRINGG